MDHNALGVSDPKISPKNQPTAGQYCFGMAKPKPKNVFRSTLNLCIKLL